MTGVAKDDEVPAPDGVPAPELRETADIWFDTGRDPVITWDVDGRTFILADPGDPANRLTLFTSERRVADPDRVARVLAEGLAACDFPPTGDGASRSHVERALRVAGLDPDTL